MDKLTNDQIAQVIDEMDVETVAESYNENWLKVWMFEEVLWAFGEQKEFKAWDKVDIQIMRTWKRNHSLYWEIKVDETVLTEVVKNFEEDKRWIKLAVDENHEPNHKALARYDKLYLKGKNALFATLELTKKGAELLNEWAYKYFSPEIYFAKRDEETWEIQKNLLIGGAFTNRPFFKAMQPLLASEDGLSDVSNRHQTNGWDDVTSWIYIFNNSTHMNKFIQLMAKFSELASITKEQKEELSNAFNSLPEEYQTAEFKEQFDTVCAKFSEDGDDSEEGQQSWTDEGQDGEGEWEGEWSDSEAWEWEGEGEWADTIEAIKANEDWSVVLSATQFSEFKAMQKELAQKVLEARKADIESKVKSMVFSEANKNSLVLPKQKNEIVSFAVSLSEQQCERFLKIVWGLKAVAASEIWTSKSTTAVSFSEEEKKTFNGLWLTSEEDMIEAKKHLKN